MRQIEIANNDLEKSKIKKLHRYNFFSVIDHDMRNPFNALLGYSEFLSKSARQLNPKEVQQLAATIHKSADLIFRLYENLIQWTKLQMELFEFMPEKISLNRIVDNAVNKFLNYAFTKRIRIENHLEKNIYIYTDPDAVNIVFSNLLANAIKFTMPGGTVQIIGSMNKEFYELNVLDEGIGMEEEDLKLLLVDEEFYRKEGTAKEIGLGIGLKLCKEIIEKTGGKIKVESKKNEGSNFTVTFPISN